MAIASCSGHFPLVFEFLWFARSATHGRIVLFLLALLPLARLRRKICVEPPRRLHAELERPEREDPLLIATIAEHVHAVVKEMEADCATDNPAYDEIKQYGSDLDQYESVRLTTEGLHYGIALIDQFLKIGSYVHFNSPSLHSELLVKLLGEHIQRLNHSAAASGSAVRAH